MTGNVGSVNTKPTYHRENLRGRLLEDALGVLEAEGLDALNLRGRVDALESELVRSALKRTQGNQTRAAALLGLSRFGLQKMIKRLQIAAD